MVDGILPTRARRDRPGHRDGAARRERRAQHDMVNPQCGVASTSVPE
jgi:hypothetical protein